MAALLRKKTCLVLILCACRLPARGDDALQVHRAGALLLAAQGGPAVEGAAEAPPASGRALTTEEVTRSLKARANRVSWDKAKLARFLAAMPKAETHVHLDGTLSPETIQELARRQNYAPLKDKSLEEIRKLAVVDAPRESLGKVLEAFKAFYPLLRTPEAVELMAYDYLKAAAKDNIRYVEVRFAPALQAAGKFDVEAVVDAALKGLRRGERDFKVRSGLILCLYRPLSKEQNEAMLKAALRRKGQGVVGVDLAGDEAQYPLSDFKDLFKRAKTGGLSVTVHAGEVPGSKDLQTALELGVDRLSHATILDSQPDVLQEVAGKRVPIEVNLTSNLRTGAVGRYEDHPVKGWIEKGIPVSISTDDPGVFGVTLTQEYQILADKLGLGPSEIIALQVGAIDSLFLPETGKAELRSKFLAETAAALDSLR